MCSKNKENSSVSRFLFKIIEVIGFYIVYDNFKKKYNKKENYDKFKKFYFLPFLNTWYAYLKIKISHYS